MPAPSDLVHETTTTTGTSDLTLANEFGKRSFNTAFSTGGTNVFDYFVSHRTAAEWERGTGHLSSSTVLVRDTVIASSNSNSAVNFASGTKDVTNDIPAASQAIVSDVQTFTGSGTWNKPSSFASTSRVHIQLWGGGGGGSRNATGSSNMGGGGGGYMDRWVALSVLGSSETITIGAAGAGRTASAGNGSNGGTTTVGSLASAFGGGGGVTGADTIGRSATATETNVYTGYTDGLGAVQKFKVLDPYSGGCGAGSADNPGKGVYGGGGGKGGAVASGATSVNGGAGGNGASTPTAGTQPAGGGGASSSGNVNGADGGAGMVVITVHA